jgi:putative zinc finger protein
MSYCTQYVEAIQEMVDGTLGSIRRAELEIHLDQCDGCRALTRDLQRIRDFAGTLDRPAPPDRVWLQVAGRLRQEGRVRPTPTLTSVSRRPYVLAALAASLLLLVSGSLYFLTPLGRGTRQSTVAGAPGPATPAATAQGNVTAGDPVQEGIESEFRLAEQHYRNAITRLEEAAKNDKDSIDPRTAAMLQKNLDVIDQAIAESSAAVRSEPTSVAARDSLFDALKRKVSLLQDTIALMNEMRKGNAAAVAQMMDGVNKG